MAISCSDLKDFAAGLVVAAADETSLRAAVSRAYYAGFHAVLPFVDQLPRSATCPPKVHHITHQEMLDRLREWKTGSLHPKLPEMTTTKGQLVRALDVSRALRVKADYRLGEHLTAGEAQMQVERARQVMRAVAQVNMMIEGGADSAATSGAGAA